MGFLDKLFGVTVDTVCAPISGSTVPVSQVPDPTFGEEILGKGVAILPQDTKVVAPCNGKLEQMFDTGHAFSMTADFGAEILVHIGLETVNLKGRHFTIHAHSGDTVKKGQLLIEFDKAAIEAEGYNTITPVVICNSDDYSTVAAVTGKTLQAGDPLLTLKK